MQKVLVPAGQYSTTMILSPHSFDPFAGPPSQCSLLSRSVISPCTRQQMLCCFMHDRLHMFRDIPPLDTCLPRRIAVLVLPERLNVPPSAIAHVRVVSSQSHLLHYITLPTAASLSLLVLETHLVLGLAAVSAAAGVPRHVLVVFPDLAYDVEEGIVNIDARFCRSLDECASERTCELTALCGYGNNG